MRLWRICKQKHLKDALSGEGARRAGGRWNHRGEPLVYTSTSLSLACLELFVHLEPNLAPDDLFSISFDLPTAATTEEISASQLPAGWRSYPAPPRLQEIGAQWIREQRTLALIVPSAVNPEEKNLLINPLHPQARILGAVAAKPFQFDPRMRSKR